MPQQSYEVRLEARIESLLAKFFKLEERFQSLNENRADFELSKVKVALKSIDLKKTALVNFIYRNETDLQSIKRLESSSKNRIRIEKRVDNKFQQIEKKYASLESAYDALFEAELDALLEDALLEDASLEDEFDALANKSNSADESSDVVSSRNPNKPTFSDQNKDQVELDTEHGDSTTNQDVEPVSTETKLTDTARNQAQSHTGAMSPSKLDSTPIYQTQFESEPESTTSQEESSKDRAVSPDSSLQTTLESSATSAPENTDVPSSVVPAAAPQQQANSTELAESATLAELAVSIGDSKSNAPAAHFEAESESTTSQEESSKDRSVSPDSSLQTALESSVTSAPENTDLPSPVLPASEPQQQANSTELAEHAVSVGDSKTSEPAAHFEPVSTEAKQTNTARNQAQSLTGAMNRRKLGGAPISQVQPAVSVGGSEIRAAETQFEPEFEPATADDGFEFTLPHEVGLKRDATDYQNNAAQIDIHNVNISPEKLSGIRKSLDLYSKEHNVKLTVNYDEDTQDLRLSIPSTQPLLTFEKPDVAMQQKRQATFEMMLTYFKNRVPNEKDIVISGQDPSLVAFAMLVARDLNSKLLRPIHEESIRYSSNAVAVEEKHINEAEKLYEQMKEKLTVKIDSTSYDINASKWDGFGCSQSTAAQEPPRQVRGQGSYHQQRCKTLAREQHKESVQEGTHDHEPNQFSSPSL